jgi:hypothetical protein
MSESAKDIIGSLPKSQMGDGPFRYVLSEPELENILKGIERKAYASGLEAAAKEAKSLEISESDGNDQWWEGWNAAIEQIELNLRALIEGSNVNQHGFPSIGGRRSAPRPGWKE